MKLPIRIVLVNTSHPGNIGACARAMKTMGLSELVLVAPKRFPDADATARASGADDVLYHARVTETLDEAITSCGLVVGASARLRSLSWPVIGPRECGRDVVAAASQAPVAVVFGNEQSGLSNEELERCRFLVHIPTNPGYGSLNLAMAVQIIVYEIRMASTGSGEGIDQQPMGDGRASAADMQLFYTHLEQVLTETGFLDSSNPRHLMRRLRRLFNRAEPDADELGILRGMLSSTQRRSNR